MLIPKPFYNECDLAVQTFLDSEVSAFEKLGMGVEEVERNANSFEARCH
jgi:hypothetical protein